MEIDPDKIARSPFLIGALGALITALRFTPGASWPERIINVLSGAVIAGFVTPALVEWVHHNPPEGYINAAAFVVGLLGMSLIAAAIDWLRSGKLGEAISSWTVRR